MTYPLLALGASHVGLGQYREALPSLERAARIREAKEKSPSRNGEVHFALGRALWGSGQDWARALAMVERARDEFRANPATPATQRELADIELWLASRSDPRVRGRSRRSPAGAVEALEALHPRRRSDRKRRSIRTRAR